MKKYKFIVVGGGTAGIIAATRLKSYWNDLVDVTVIYDHKNPGIGVGESVTPNFTSFNKSIGIKTADLVKNVNATIKTGLKFKNWLNNDKYFYHGFFLTSQPALLREDDAYGIANNSFANSNSYTDNWFENYRIPNSVLLDADAPTYSFHIDATVYSKYLETIFKDKITIIDGVVTDIELENGNIKTLILKNGNNLKGDFFIDASGFPAILFKKLNSKWVDKKDWLPINRCIPNPLPWKYSENKIPTYTTACATEDGWALNVPLQNRWGTGYLYCSDFLDDETAFKKFENYLTKTYGPNTLNNKSRVLSFSSGYWEKQWLGNCLAVGLSSGFAEPLEATNILHVVHQLNKFVQIFNFKIFDYDRNTYNKQMEDFYNDIYHYIRLIYCTNRTDSNFWQYMTHNTPKSISEFIEKINSDIINSQSYQTLSSIFTGYSLTTVALGLGLIDKNAYNIWLKNKSLEARAAMEYANREIIKQQLFNQSLDHYSYITNIRSN
jgi:tryptophan halogenase